MLRSIGLPGVLSDCLQNAATRAGGLSQGVCLTGWHMKQVNHYGLDEFLQASLVILASVCTGCPVWKIMSTCKTVGHMGIFFVVYRGHK